MPLSCDKRPARVHLGFHRWQSWASKTQQSYTYTQSMFYWHDLLFKVNWHTFCSFWYMKFYTKNIIIIWELWHHLHPCDCEMITSDYCRWTGKFGIDTFVFQKRLLYINSNFVRFGLQFKITVFYCNVFYSCHTKLNFQHLYSSLQCHLIRQKSL